jgi:hypothetical protein
MEIMLAIRVLPGFVVLHSSPQDCLHMHEKLILFRNEQ